MTTENSLRDYIRGILQEDGADFSTRLLSPVIAAQKAYDDAMADLERGKVELTKFQNFENAFKMSRGKVPPWMLAAFGVFDIKPTPRNPELAVSALKNLFLKSTPEKLKAPLNDERLDPSAKAVIEKLADNIYDSAFLQKISVDGKVPSIGRLERRFDAAAATLEKLQPDYSEEIDKEVEAVENENPEPGKGKKSKDNKYDAENEKMSARKAQQLADEKLRDQVPNWRWSSKKYAMKWTPWPSNIEKMAGCSFGKQKEGQRGEKVGTGPGERWLAYIFNGDVMGGSVSYDIVMPGGTKCESKELDSASALIRPGTEGLAAYLPALEQLFDVVKQLRRFIKAAEMADIVRDISGDDRKMWYSVSNFMKEETENLVGKGEISEERFRKFLILLEKLADFKSRHTGRKTDIKPSISINNKKYNVSVPTYIDVAQAIESDPQAQSDVGNEKILQNIEKWQIVLNELKAEAFSNPKKFLDQYASAIDVDKVFQQVDGLFIVNEGGFFWIPKDQLKGTLVFNSVSQGKPKFRFTLFGAGPSAPSKAPAPPRRRTPIR